MLLNRLSRLDFAIIALAAFAATMMLERQHRIDIEARDPAETIAAQPSCRGLLENRRFVIRRMLIADGSPAIGNLWRSDALVGACDQN